MIDAAEFLNSKDIADYWREIGFAARCTPLQCAYIVRCSRSKTLAEKHAAWREIVATSPDCPVAAGHRRANMGIPDALADSLHAFLQAFMRLQERLVDAFYRAGDCAVYRYNVLYKGEEDWTRDDFLYGSPAECFAEVNADEDLLPEVACLQLTKQWIGENRRITLFTKADKTVLAVDADGLAEGEADLLRAFEWMWFDFPTPFKRGDVVVSQYSPCGYNVHGDDPFVLTNLCSWGGAQLRENGCPDREGRYAWADKLLVRHRECGDETDMTAHGYFQSEDGGIYHECMHHYLDLAYYREEPQGARRILRALSNFIKGEIGEDLFAVAYHAILQEEDLRRQREKLSCFTDEGLRLAGLL